MFIQTNSVYINSALVESVYIKEIIQDCFLVIFTMNSKQEYTAGDFDSYEEATKYLNEEVLLRR